MTSDAQSATRFGLLRQVEDEWNKDNWIQGRVNNPLKDEGENQAKVWGRILNHFQWNRILTSPEGRSLETAEIVNSRIELPVLTDSRLLEQDWGTWTGKTIEQIMKEEPALYEELECATWDFRPPGGEDRNAVLQRTKDALKEAYEKYPNENILVVTHEGVIRCLVYHLLEEYMNRTKKTSVVLTNQLHWLLYFKEGMILEELNALPLP